jgi:predicted acyltransferase
MGGVSQAPVSPSPPRRLVTLDAYRGFTMLAMVSGGFGTAHLLNDPTWGWFADQMEHRDWIGCTAWDLIQPSFMFIVGAAMPFAFALRRERGESWGRQLGHAVKRSLLLVAIGVFLDSYAQDRVYVQFIRVLQQIAIGYLLAFLVLGLRPGWQALLAGLILVGHTAAYLLYGRATGCWPWEEGFNLGTRLDVLLHLPVSTGGYATLNALSATATILFGVLCGELLRSDLPAARKLLTLAVAGVGGLWLGVVLSPLVPIIKRLWTASFALYAGGWTCMLLLAFYVLVDVLHYQRWTFPLVVVGMNSIAVYCVSQLGKPLIRNSLRPFVTPWLRDLPRAGPVILMALVVLVEWSICYWLYRRRNGDSLLGPEGLDHGFVGGQIRPLDQINAVGNGRKHRH